jgi:hypothetical protein
VLEQEQAQVQVQVQVQALTGHQKVYRASKSLQINGMISLQVIEKILEPKPTTTIVPD